MAALVLPSPKKSVSIQGSGKLTANFSSAEPLTAA
jgi:hypothetical protein